MPFPLPKSKSDKTESALGVRLPPDDVTHPKRRSGGEVIVQRKAKWPYPFHDDSDRGG